MLFLFECPNCGARIEADASASGRQAHCPQCRGMVAVPESRVDCGATLGGFRLESRLGKGGMGEVFLGTQLSVERRVAVKVLPPSFAADRSAVERFLQEGRLAARLDHANIVTVHEAGEDCGHYYMAMAYVEGESLDQRLKRDGSLPEREALAIIRTIAEALDYAWDEFHLLHRDLKPADIMTDRRGRVFLMDLGLAKTLGDETAMTLSGTILGTPHYMSPEQAMGSTRLSVQTDIYALGATLYHLVVGAPPFTGDSALKVLNQHVHEPLPPARSRNPRVSEACSALIGVMMAKAPEDRCHGWRDLIAAIDRVLSGAAAPASPPTGVGAAPGSAAEPYTGTGWAREVVHEATGIAMVYIPAGSFTMGSPRDEMGRGGNERQHPVTLTRGFYMGKYEVTQGQWAAVMGSNPSRFRNAGTDVPVESVSWDDCQAFCRKLGEGFLLPTEAGSSPMPGGSMTCWVMSGSGARTGTATIRRVR